MKSYLLKIICFLLMNSAIAQNEFITTWKTDNPGTSNDNQITIPTTGIGYNYDIDWEMAQVMKLLKAASRTLTLHREHMKYLSQEIFQESILIMKVTRIKF